jgi:hypothetical protein
MNNGRVEDNLLALSNCVVRTVEEVEPGNLFLVHQHNESRWGIRVNHPNDQNTGLPYAAAVIFRGSSVNGRLAPTVTTDVVKESCIDFGCKPQVLWSGDVSTMSRSTPSPAGHLLLSGTDLAINCVYGGGWPTFVHYWVLATGVDLQRNRFKQYSGWFITRWKLGIPDSSGKIALLLRYPEDFEIRGEGT